MDLHVSLGARQDITGQIYRQVRRAVLDGRLRPGEALPPSRELATRLAVARNTVSSAYDRLVAEGFLTSRVGVGTYVSAQLPASGRGAGPARSRADDLESPLRPRRLWDAIPDPPDLLSTQAEFDFRPGMPDARHFPFATWRALVAAELRGSARHLGRYGDPAGHPELRAAIARHIGVSRAVSATAEDVIVTNGVQQAVDLVGRVLLEPGDVVALEDPGYPPPKHLFESQGARVVGVPVDADGLVVDALPDDAKLVYVSPSHQFPLGSPMSLARRLNLLAWAERTGAVVLEDDYDSEFRYTGRPIEPLHCLDHTGQVLYLGSFSKVTLPALRLGFLVAPAPLRSALRKAKFVTDWHTAQPMQAALAQFIDGGSLARHVRRMRGVYQVRRDLITLTLDRDFAGLLAPISSVAGLHLAAWLRTGAPDDDLVLAKRARALGVAVVPLSYYAFTLPPRPGLVLGYGLIEADRISEGLDRLHSCFGRFPTATAA